MMPLLIAACPSFASKWNDYSRSADYDAELEYLHLAEFARHLIALEQHDSKSEFPTVFEVVERLHIEGAQHVREAATIEAKKH
jgi:hypothetical protein